MPGEELNNTVINVFPLINEISVIHWFGAADLDLGNNATVEYELLMNDELTRKVGHTFSVDERGYFLINGHSLQKSNVFDLSDRYHFTVVAKDKGTPNSLQSIINLEVKIDEKYFSLIRTSIDRLEMDTLSGKNLAHIEENSAVDTKIAKIIILNSFSKVNSTESDPNKVDLKFSLLTCNETFR